MVAKQSERDPYADTLGSVRSQEQTEKSDYPLEKLNQVSLAA